jgi:hypothetical protein
MLIPIRLPVFTVLLYGAVTAATPAKAKDPTKVGAYTRCTGKDSTGTCTTISTTDDAFDFCHPYPSRDQDWSLTFTNGIFVVTYSDEKCSTIINRYNGPQEYRQIGHPAAWFKCGTV